MAKKIITPNNHKKTAINKAAGLCENLAARSRTAKTPIATMAGIFSEAIVFTRLDFICHKSQSPSFIRIKLQMKFVKETTYHGRKNDPDNDDEDQSAEQGIKPRK